MRSQFIFDTEKDYDIFLNKACIHAGFSNSECTTIGCRKCVEAEYDVVIRANKPKEPKEPKNPFKEEPDTAIKEEPEERGELTKMKIIEEMCYKIKDEMEIINPDTRVEFMVEGDTVRFSVTLGLTSSGVYRTQTLIPVRKVIVDYRHVSTQLYLKALDNYVEFRSRQRNSEF